MKDYFLYLLIKLSVSLTAMLPKQILSFLSNLLGTVWYQIDRRHREIAMRNVKYSFPGKFSSLGVELFVKKVFKNTVSILFDAIGSYHKTQREFFEYFTIKNGHYFNKASSKGKGVVILTCHMGNFELIVGAIPKIGIKNPYGIYRKFDSKPLENFMLEYRQRFGMKMLATGGLSKKIDSLLKKNCTIGTLFDQNADFYDGVFVDFFGRPACAHNSLAKIILRTNASVVPMFIIKKNDKHIIEFLPEVPLELTGCPIKDIEKNTQNYVTAVEKMVRKCPEQYFWVHDRWKSKPYTLIKDRWKSHWL